MTRYSKRTLWVELDNLEKRDGNITTEAVCDNSYSWMNNENNQSPCFVAAILSAACQTKNGGWDVPAVGLTNHYAFPNSTTANYCICSWAVYNLLGACTVCQGSTSVDNWSPYVAGCGSYATNTAFPTNLITVPNNTLLQYWAGADPSTWSGGSFNSDQASSIHSQGHSDINLSAPSPAPSQSSSSSPSSSSTNSSSNVGAIAGGTIGGIVAIVGLVVLVLYLRRRRRRKSRKLALLDPLPNATIHGRSLSDTTQMTQMTLKADHAGFSPEFRPTTSPPNMHYANGTLTSLNRSHTTTPSLHSLPYDVSLIHAISTSPPPPPPPTSQRPQSQDLENVIVPYTMTSASQDLLSTDRKRADGNLFPIFEQQNEYQSGSLSADAQPGTSRRRMNPPSYNESVTSGEASVIRSLAPSRSVDYKRRGHGPQESSDTADSSSTWYGTESSWSPTQRRTQMVRESALSGISAITGIRSELGPSSVIGIGTAAVASPTDPGTEVNMMSVAGSVVGGGDNIA